MANPFPADCARRFEPVRLIAEGSYGQVWLATQRSLGRSAAVKLLRGDIVDDPEHLSRFTAEAKVTAKLSHPAIVVVLDFGADAGVPWIAYEHVPGKSLRDMLLVRPIPIALALRAAHQVAGALAVAHEAGVLHRDIKPENVLHVEEDRFKVADFGLAKWSGSESIRTRTGMIMGTPSAMAPELLLGEPASAASDLYALGALLYETIAGQEPFPARSVPEVLDHHLHTPAPRLRALVPQVPAALDDLCLALLAKNPADRPRDATALGRAIDAIEAALASSGTGADARRAGAATHDAGASPDLSGATQVFQSAATGRAPSGDASTAGAVATQVVTGPFSRRPTGRAAASVPDGARGQHRGDGTARETGRSGPGGAGGSRAAPWTAAAIAVAAAAWIGWRAGRTSVTLPSPDASSRATVAAVAGGDQSSAAIAPASTADAGASESSDRWRSWVREVDVAWDQTLGHLADLQALFSPDVIAGVADTSENSPAGRLSAKTRRTRVVFQRLITAMRDLEMASGAVPWPARASLARCLAGLFCNGLAEDFVLKLAASDVADLARPGAEVPLRPVRLPDFSHYLDELSRTIKDADGGSGSYTGRVTNPLWDLYCVSNFFDVTSIGDAGASGYRDSVARFTDRVRRATGPLSGPLATVSISLWQYHVLDPSKAGRKRAIEAALEALDLLCARAPAAARSARSLHDYMEKMGPRSGAPRVTEVIPDSLLPAELTTTAPTSK